MSLKDLKADDVNTPEMLARFCQQQTGIPYPTGKQIALLKKAIKGFFAAYPDASYSSLTNLVMWSKIRDRRYAHVANLVNGGVRYAYMEGFLPELDPRRKNDNIDRLIDEALQVEKDPQTRAVLLNAWTETSKKQIYEDWLSTQKELV